MLSAPWVIPRKRTSGEKSGRFRALTPVGCWLRRKRTISAFSPLKKRLQGSSLWLPSGEETMVYRDGSMRGLSTKETQNQRLRAAAVRERLQPVPNRSAQEHKVETAKHGSPNPPFLVVAYGSAAPRRTRRFPNSSGGEVRPAQKSGQTENNFPEIRSNLLKPLHQHPLSRAKQPAPPWRKPPGLPRRHSCRRLCRSRTPSPNPPKKPPTSATIFPQARSIYRGVSLRRLASHLVRRRTGSYNVKRAFTTGIHYE